MYKTIIFDLDGTLWDSTKQIKNVWSKIAKNYGLTINDNEINKIMGFTKEEIVEYLFCDNKKNGEKFITECQEEEVVYLSKYGGNIYSNTISTIEELSKKYELYIVSNCQTGYIEAFLSYYNLNKYFKDYECSGNTLKDKSFNIREIMKRNKILNAVYIGDTDKDYQATRQANIKFIWAKYGFGICKKYDFAIKDIKELIQLKLED
ncbi:MAG: HAD family hydrolase [Clostridia bacterium]|nr:HAD family hydrolase [Clostridia bacterium]